ncbi:hypothetical protein RHGRI_037181 [Rhododendron griersonianum]|uniref:Uncharacterized protein n=1 Tax=Rhododendron griersonianum TaxID=479676 RepID=A0AAV6HQT2_9ERIC|nr:hypothetical protein RHGRI_037181 [Rhododendron griersonianum]
MTPSTKTKSILTRFDAFNCLLAAAFAFGENLPIPKIVAFGKSLLFEALPGFRFNVREVEMGTRRPLILPMVHDPTALEPQCRFQSLNSHLIWDLVCQSRVLTLSEQPEVVAKMASGVGVQPLYPISMSHSRLLERYPTPLSFYNMLTEQQNLW